MWNLRGLCYGRRQKELKDLLRERKIDIFGTLETKLKQDRRTELKAKLDEEWETVNNGDVSSELRDSIWVGWCKNTWNRQTIHNGQQLIHLHLLNNGGYGFALTVVY